MLESENCITEVKSAASKDPMYFYLTFKRFITKCLNLTFKVNF